ncbi:unnamed protein product, partial [marine sediment metagenome]
RVKMNIDVKGEFNKTELRVIQKILGYTTGEERKKAGITKEEELVYNVIYDQLNELFNKVLD